ncbi:MAG: hypothetical protein KKC18_10570 [Chloroflexi bacterium]|nr:hypothetical protein [Chloroflexota bacterium]
MAKYGRMQRVVMGVLAVMLVTSFLLTVISLVAATTAKAAPPPPQPDYQCPSCWGPWYTVCENCCGCWDAGDLKKQRCANSDCDLYWQYGCTEPPCGG